MERLEGLYAEYSALTFEERVSNARSAYFKLRKELASQGHSELDSIELLIGLVGVLSCVDGVPSKHEYSLFVEVTKSNITKDQFLHLIQGTKTPEMVDGAKRLIDSLSPKGKDAACIFCLCFLSADGRIDVYEKELFERLLF